MKILITGVAGFIGSNLADALLNMCAAPGTPRLLGLKIIGIDDLSYGVLEQVPAGVEFHRLDIRSREIYALFKGVDYVFHLAAKNCISDCQTDPVATADINITGTANVFAAGRLGGVKKVVYAESSAVYEGLGVFPTPESEACPQSFYAVSKYCARMIAEAYKRHFGLNSTALRYFNVYGPRQDYRRSIPPVMSAFIINLLKGERPKIYGTGGKLRDFVHVNDVNDFHIMCMLDKRTDNQCFNIGNGVNYSINDIYGIIRRLLGIDMEPMYSRDLPGEAEKTLADITKARGLGWNPKVGIEDGLRGMIEYIKNQIYLGNIA